MINVNLCNKIFERIDTYRDEIISLQEKITAIPALAPESGGKGELEKAKYLKQYMDKIGFDQFEEINAPDPGAENGIRPNHIYYFNGKDNSKTIWVMSHFDIVPPGELKDWKTDPYKIHIDGDKIYGRGVEDNQQGIVSSIMAIKALREENIMPEHRVALLFVADEETGSAKGISYMLQTKPDLFKKEDIIVIPDGGLEDAVMVEVAEKSIMWIKFTTNGKQTHASRPETGINAHKAAANLIVRLDKLYNIFNSKNELFTPPISTFEPTKKENNVPNVNTIPGEDVFYLDCRVLPEYKLQDVLDKINEMVAEIEKEFNVKIKYEFPQKEQAAPATPADAPVVKMLINAIKEVYNVNAKPMGIGGGTVAACLRRKGLNAAVWSKIDETAHVANEYCRITNVMGDAKVFAHLFVNN